MTLDQELRDEVFKAVWAALNCCECPGGVVVDQDRAFEIGNELEAYVLRNFQRVTPEEK